jgi:hypothetical protein
MTESTAARVRTNRLRRSAKRQKLQVGKDRARDERAWRYDRWYVIDSAGTMLKHSRDLGEIEQFIYHDYVAPED